MAFLLPVPSRKHSSAATARLHLDDDDDGLPLDNMKHHRISSHDDPDNPLSEETATLTSLGTSDDESDDEYDSEEEDDEDVMSNSGGSVISTSTGVSLTEFIGDYSDGDLHTLNSLVNKLHAAEIARELRGRQNEQGGDKSKTQHVRSLSDVSANGGFSSSTVLEALPSELPERPPSFSPLSAPPTASESVSDSSSAHHSRNLSFSAVESWRGPSLEVVPTENVERILPLWNDQWSEDRREWEALRRQQRLSADAAIKRSRTQDDGESASKETTAPGVARHRSEPLHAPAAAARSRSPPRSNANSGAIRSASPPGSTPSAPHRHYKYGRPPTLPSSREPNPMVTKSSKRIDRRHARYALTAGMMLGIRESVGGALGAEAELEMQGWEDELLDYRRMSRGAGADGGDARVEELADADVDVSDNVRSNSESQEGDIHGNTKSQASAAPSSTPPKKALLRYAKALTDECRRATKYDFPPDTFYLGSNTAKPLPHRYKFKVYAPSVFARIRSLFGVEKQTFLHSICGKFNFYEFASNARSGQFFFYSHDGRYMIKTLTFTESKFLREILPYYYRHLQNNPSTFLTHFYGMYRVCMPHYHGSSTGKEGGGGGNGSGEKLHFVIMRSVFHSDKKIDKIWDLKGSRAGRRAKPGDSVGKDLDILEEGRRLRFKEPGTRGAFLDQLAKDATFLARLGIMDYSLLLGLHECGEDGQSTSDGATSRERGASSGATSAAADGSQNSPASATNASRGRAITSRLDSGIEGYGRAESPNNGKTLSKREIYYCGIIDILQYYNARKLGETVVRQAAGNSGRDISCVDPETYGKRFVRFVSNLIDENE